MSEAVSGKRLTTRDRQRIETRERVFQAALAEFQRVGSASAQIPKIVEEAGVAVGTFYRYFASKEDVLVELQRRFVVGVTHRFEEQSARAKTLKDVLYALADSILQDRSESDMVLEREALALVVRRRWIAPDWGDNPLFGPVTAQFRDEQATGTIRSHHSPEKLTRLVATSILGFATGIAVASEERRRSAHEVIDLLLDGLEPRV